MNGTKARKFSEMALGSIAGGAMCIGLAMTVVPMAATSAQAQDMEASIARGGRLYDKWYKVIGAEGPADTHSAWPDSNTKKSGDTTWRCKSCHGWDLLGKDGAYASGSYLTGITGLAGMADGDPAAVVSAMKDATHGYDGMMSDADFMDLANFVAKGQFDIRGIIDYETKAASGDAARGGAIYGTVCAACHGDDGMLPKDMPPLGELANGNPWEIIQKIMNGQPAEKMPALRVFGTGTAGDVLAYLQTLPKE